MEETNSDTLSAEQRKELYESLRKVWNLGANVIVGWNCSSGGLTVYYLSLLALPRAARQNADLLSRNNHIVDAAHRSGLIDAGCEHAELSLSFAMSDDAATRRQVETIMRHYTVTHTACRAVALFDMVGFSLYSAFVRLAQINVLSYHINLAAERVAAAGLPVDLTTTTTGDGFYIWNRIRSLEADLALYYITVLTLAFNRAAMIASPHEPIPELRGCFDFGEHYEYYQATGTKPDSRGYIVGDVTIKLARLISAAQPRQFLVGNSVRRPEADTGSETASDRLGQIDMSSFVLFARSNTRILEGVGIGNGTIVRADTFLTGDRVSEGEFTINKYVVTDKHGFAHRFFNARFDVQDSADQKIVAGLATGALSGFEGSRIEDEDIRIKVV